MLKTIFIGGYDFLVVILIGSLISTINSYFLTYERTKMICYLSYLFNNIVSE